MTDDQREELHRRRAAFSGGAWPEPARLGAARRYAGKTLAVEAEARAVAGLPPVEPLVRLAPGHYVRPSDGFTIHATPSASNPFGNVRVAWPTPRVEHVNLGPDGSDDPDVEARRVAALLGIPVVEPGEDAAEARANAMGLTTKPWEWDREREAEAAKRLPPGLCAAAMSPEPTTIIATSCDACPFAHWSEQAAGIVCTHKGGPPLGDETPGYEDGDGIPDACPLRSAPVRVEVSK